MFSGERANLTIHRQGKSASSGPVSRSGNSSPPWLHPAQSLRAAPVGSQLLRGVTVSLRGKAQLHGGGSGRTVSWVPGPTPFSNIPLLSDAALAPAPGDSPWPPGACPRPQPRLSSQASLPHLRRLSPSSPLPCSRAWPSGPGRDCRDTSHWSLVEARWVILPAVPACSRDCHGFRRQWESAPSSHWELGRLHPIVHIPAPLPLVVNQQKLLRSVSPIRVQMTWVSHIVATSFWIHSPNIHNFTPGSQEISICSEHTIKNTSKVKGTYDSAGPRE